MLSWGKTQGTRGQTQNLPRRTTPSAIHHLPICTDSEVQQTVCYLFGLNLSETCAILLSRQPVWWWSVDQEVGGSNPHRNMVWEFCSSSSPLATSAMTSTLITYTVGGKVNCFVLYSSIYIAPLNSNGQTEANYSSQFWSRQMHGQWRWK